MVFAMKISMSDTYSITKEVNYKCITRYPTENPISDSLYDSLFEDGDQIPVGYTNEVNYFNY